MQEVLNDPVIQSSVAPFAVGLIFAGLFFPLRLAGLAAGAGFLATVWMIGNFGLTPLTATRKIVLLGMAAPVLGVIADLAYKPKWFTGMVLGIVFAAASYWVFETVLVQKALDQRVLHGGGIALFMVWLVAFTVSLQQDPVRAGAAGLGLGLGAGVGAVLGASALLGQYGMALGAACGAFLLLVMILGKRVAAGATFTLTASVVAALLASGAMLLAQVPWTSLVALALIPLAVRLPIREKSPVWLQAIVASLYSLAVAAGACFLAWQTGRGPSG